MPRLSDTKCKYSTICQFLQVLGAYLLQNLDNNPFVDLFKRLSLSRL